MLLPELVYNKQCIFSCQSNLKKKHRQYGVPRGNWGITCILYKENYCNELLLVKYYQNNKAYSKGKLWNEKQKIILLFMPI